MQEDRWWCCGQQETATTMACRRIRNDDIFSAFVLLVSMGITYILYIILHPQTFLISNFDLGDEFQITHPPNSIRIHYYNKPDFIKTSVFSGCEYRCHMSYGHRYYKNSKFVVFFGPYINTNTPLIRKYNGQVWIMHSKESVANWGNFSAHWNSLFNWTMNFRRDSDIYTANGIFEARVRKRNESLLEEIDDMWDRKKEQAAWFVSNCNTSSRRETFVEELRKYIDVHIFGKCGSFKCPRNVDSECLDILKEKYKFYLAFENSLCYDYITEKSFKVYNHVANAIPITRGCSNEYSIFLPKGSYISANDFSNIQSLGMYLKDLANNKNQFYHFLEWGNSFRAYYSFPAEFCELCRRANDAEKYKRVYTDMNAWLRGSYRHKELGCLSPHDIR